MPILESNILLDRSPVRQTRHEPEGIMENASMRYIFRSGMGHCIISLGGKLAIAIAQKVSLVMGPMIECRPRARTAFTADG